MSIKKYTASKDNTIASAFKLNLSDRSTASNMGASDILEVFSIFGQASSSSLEQSRILIQFPVDLIQADRASGAVPGSGSVNFKLKMYNAEHNQTVPEKVTLTVTPIVKSWNEGGGLDMETYLDEGPSSWHSASSNVAWANTGGDFLSEDYMNSTPIPIEFTQYLQNGTEDVDIDVTPFVEQLLVNQTGASTPASGSIIFNMSNNTVLILDKSFFRQPYEIVFRSFSDSIKLIGQRYNAVRGKKIDNILDKIGKNSFNSETLGGCIIKKAHQTVIISKEY